MILARSCFQVRSGTAFGVGNYLKRYLKPLAEKAGIHDLTHQAFRRTSSTHMQNHATVKDMQRHLRHTDPQTTLKHYAKVIPASLRSAVAALDAQITGTPVTQNNRVNHSFLSLATWSHRRRSKGTGHSGTSCKRFSRSLRNLAHFQIDRREPRLRSQHPARLTPWSDRRELLI